MLRHLGYWGLVQPPSPPQYGPPGSTVQRFSRIPPAAAGAARVNDGRTMMRAVERMVVVNFILVEGC